MRVAVICIGNELLLDEGVGPACGRYLEARYELPEEVEVLDRAVMGMAIISDLRQCDVALVLDAVEVPGAEPGALFSFAPEDAMTSGPATLSLHEMRFADVLAAAELMGVRCQGHCLGVQVENMSPAEFAMGLTPRVAAAVPLLAAAAVRWLRDELGLPVHDRLGDVAGLAGLASGASAAAGAAGCDAADGAEAAGGEAGGSGGAACTAGLAAAGGCLVAVDPIVAAQVRASLPMSPIAGEPDVSVMTGYLAAGLRAVGAEVLERCVEGTPVADAAANVASCEADVVRAVEAGGACCSDALGRGTRGLVRCALPGQDGGGAGELARLAAQLGPRVELGMAVSGGADGAAELELIVRPTTIDHDCDVLIGSVRQLVRACATMEGESR